MIDHFSEHILIVCTLFVNSFSQLVLIVYTFLRAINIKIN